MIAKEGLVLLLEEYKQFYQDRPARPSEDTPTEYEMTRRECDDIVSLMNVTLKYLKSNNNLDS